MPPAAPVIAQYAPALEPGDSVLDADATLAMPAPGLISNDASAAKAWEHEVSLTAVTTVGQDAAVITAERFDLRFAVVDWIVTIAWTTARTRDDTEVSPNEHL